MNPACGWVGVRLAALALTGVTLGPAVAAGPATREAVRLDVAAAAAPLTLRTVPPVAGFPVTLDDVTTLTDAQGRAHFDTTVTGEDLSGRVDLTEAVLPIDGKEVKVRADRIYESRTNPLLALDMSFSVDFRFRGPDGAVLDPGTIGQVSVKSETGEVLAVEPGEPSWLQGNRVIKRTGEMEVKDLRWRVVEVQYAGSNVVHASQQHFFPALDQDVTVDLLFFSLDVRVRDAFYDFAAGTAIELVYPDGSSRRFPLDPEGRVRVPSLPRGQYGLTILGSGPPISRPLAVSRDQSVDLGFHSWLDVGTVVGGLLALAVGLAALGRIRRRRGTAGSAGRRRRSGSRHGQQEEGEAFTNEVTDVERVGQDGRPGQLAQ